MGSQNEDYIPLKYHFTIQSNVYMSSFERLHFQIHEVKQAGGMANRHQDLEDHHSEKVMWLIPSGKHTKNIKKLWKINMFNNFFSGHGR